MVREDQPGTAGTIPGGVLPHDGHQPVRKRDRAAVAVLPSAHSPMNFDTGLVIRDPVYVRGLIHGQALSGKHRLESLDAVNELEVLG